MVSVTKPGCQQQQAGGQQHHPMGQLLARNFALIHLGLRLREKGETPGVAAARYR